VDPHLISPRTYEWSLTVEQKMGTYVQLSTSYIGNDGEKLVGEEEYHNLPSSTGAYPVNPSLIRSYGELYYITNQSHSNYQALQSQLVIKAGSKADGLISYTWSHAEDNGSTDYSSVGEAVSNPISNSANDIRHILAAAIHYAPQGTAGSGVWHAVTRGWSLDTIARLQTASPFTITVGDALPNVFDANADVVPGVPVILREHLDSFGKVVPGNRLLNWAAFTAPPTDSQGSPLRQGDSPTNGYRLFGLAQWDLAVSRDWKIWKEANLDFRVDAFNVLNAANFAGVSSGWTSKDGSSFGRATNTYAGYYGGSGIRASTTGSQLAIFQNGGPRSIQFSVKLKF
jgi:hypothetical protein